MYITMCAFKYKDESYCTMRICLIWFISSFSSMISALNLTYLVICDSNYPSVLAFAFLDEVQREFLQSNERSHVESVTRPYALIQFGGWRDTCTLNQVSHTHCYDFLQIHIAIAFIEKYMLYLQILFFMFIYVLL